MKNQHLRLDFNTGWTYRLPVGPFAAVMGGASEPKPVTLPHDAMIDLPRSADAPNGGANGFFPSTAFTYLNEWDVPTEYAGKYVALVFDGVASNALVYLNDNLVAECPLQYTRFTADLTAFIRPGERNQVRVEVRTHKDGRWYSGAGIYRGVELIVAGATHLVPDSLAVVTKQATTDAATLEVKLALANSGMSAQTVRVSIELQDLDGATLGTRDLPVTVLPGQPAELHQRFTLDTPKLWDIDAPQLYRATVRVHETDDAKTVADEYATTFGIRSIDVSAKGGLRINGVETKLRGACIHSDNGVLGTVTVLAAERRKMAIMKAAGFNAIRVAHNPASQALLDACDEVGMFVMNEAFDTWSLEKTDFDRTRNFTQWWERDIEAMVAGSVNHPSVIMYSIGNEIVELGTANGRALNRDIANKVRSIDASRPVTNGINTMLTIDMGKLINEAGGLNAFMSEGGDISESFNGIAITPEVSAAVEEVAGALDIVGYNYAEGRYELDAQTHPDRVIVGSETFPAGIAKNWELAKKFSQVVGDFTWTGWDYLGEAAIGAVSYEDDPNYGGGLFRSFPALLAYCSDIDIIGYRRPASYYREIVFGLRTAPYIAVQDPANFERKIANKPPWAWSDVVEGWSWAGFEGKPVRVEVYTDADEVELLLNGASVGRTAVGTKLAMVAEFETAYQPGELIAVAYRGGAEVSRSSLVSASGPAQLRVAADRTEIAASGSDLVHLEISATDAAGVLLNQSRERVTLSISGPGRLAGFGTSFMEPTAGFHESTQSLYDGRALAVIGATGPGEIVVTLDSETLGTQKVKLTAR